MPSKHDHLFDGIATFSALTAAARRAVKGKRRKPGAAAFMANLEKEVLRLERQLQAATYRPGRYTVIEVRDPKPRMVSAAHRVRVLRGGSWNNKLGFRVASTPLGRSRPVHGRGGSALGSPGAVMMRRAAGNLHGRDRYPCFFFHCPPPTSPSAPR